MENGVPFLEYLDPGRSMTSGGSNKSANRLYPVWKNGDMYWYDPSGALDSLDKADISYTLSSVIVYPKDRK
jgi:hypothetical protein